MSPGPVSIATPISRRCRYLSTSIVAIRLGVTARTIRLWAESGRIPAIKIGRQWRIEANTFETWLSQHQKLLPTETKILGNSGNNGNGPGTF